MQEFSKGCGPNDMVYPVTDQFLTELKPCDLVSPAVGRPNGLTLPPEYDDLEVLAKEVSKVRGEVVRGEFPRWFFEKYYPAEWGEFPETIPAPLAAEGLHFSRPEGLANVVHMDNPLDMPKAVLRWLIGAGCKPKHYDSRFDAFLDLIPITMSAVAEHVSANLTRGFQAKYYFGVARPEEVMGWNMTHYPEGCPSHPEYPAGHGCAAGAVQFFIDEWELDAAAIKVVRDSAYIWAMARSLAGVHYPQANVAGLKIGGML